MSMTTVTGSMRHVYAWPEVLEARMPAETLFNLYIFVNAKGGGLIDDFLYALELALPYHQDRVEALGDRAPPVVQP